MGPMLKSALFFIFVICFNLLQAKEIVILATAKSDRVTPEFSRDQVLILSGMRLVLTKEFEEQKLDSAIFWSKFDKKHFSDKEEIDFLQKFLEKAQLIPSSSESQDEDLDPDKISAMFRAEFEAEKIKEDYNKFVTDVDQVKAQTFYILPNIEIDPSLNWTDLGVTRSENFTGVVLDAWKAHFQNLFPAFESVELLDKDLNSKPEEINPNSITLKWKSVIKKMVVKKSSKTAEFELTAQYVVVNTKSNEVITSNDFPLSKKEFSLQDKKTLASGLVSWIYNLLLSQSSGIQASIEKQLKTIHKNEIDVKIIAKAGLVEVYQILSILSEQLKEAKLTAQLKSYGLEESVFTLKFESKLEKFFEIMHKKDNTLPINEKKVLVFNPADKTFAIISK
jgi:hypothetical protein